MGESVSEPRKYFRNNTVNTLNLLDAMLDHGVKRIVFSSTCATYGDPLRMPLDESHPQNPVNPYGESKFFVERIMHWYANAYGLRYAALRYFNAAGADPDGQIGEDHTPELHLIPLVIDAALGKRPHIGIYGTDYPTPDGTAVRDYIHVNDLASAHVGAEASDRGRWEPEVESRHGHGSFGARSHSRGGESQRQDHQNRRERPPPRRPGGAGGRSAPGEFGFELAAAVS